MSFIEPNLGQSQQNKKILQELEERKRRMRSNTAPIQVVSESPANIPGISSFSAIQQPAPTNSSNYTTDLSIQQAQSAILKQQHTFTLFNSSNSFGYFINTDSTLGNQILPVLPRF